MTDDTIYLEQYHRNYRHIEIYHNRGLFAKIVISANQPEYCKFIAVVSSSEVTIWQLLKGGVTPSIALVHGCRISA